MPRRPARDARVPVWVPWPLPQGWLVTGFTGAGDERSGTAGRAVALSGPNPLGGPADLLIVAEEPGVGLGAGLAGCQAPIPATASRPASRTRPSRSRTTRPRSGWSRRISKAVFAGEVAGSWLWLVLWPDTAGTLLIEPLELRDLRDPTQDLDLPFGALSPRLPA